MKKLFLFAITAICVLSHILLNETALCTTATAPDTNQQADFCHRAKSILPPDTAATETIIDTIIAYEIPFATKQRAEVLIRHYSYTVSYNPELCIPNWVAWELNAEKLVERESRNKHFSPDPKLPQDMAITTDEYKNSGWDRGHMCPAGDNKYHWRAMDASFYMTNICPQNGNLNRGDWKELEEACRVWAAKEPVYIVCGPVLYEQPRYGFIGKTFRIRIPDAFFKVVLTGLRSGHPRAIGFLYKNEAGNNPLYQYAKSVDEVERITSMDFFSALPDDIEEEIEACYDMNDWQ